MARESCNQGCGREREKTKDRKWTGHTRRRTCSVGGSGLLEARTASSHRQERSHLLSLSGLCTTALRTIADSPAWEANRRGLRGPCTLVTRLLNPNTDTQGARRGPWLWYSPTCPRFWGQGFTTVRKPSRVSAFRLRGLPGRPKLGPLPFPPMASPVRENTLPYRIRHRRVHRLSLAPLHNPLQWSPKPHPFLHACPVCHEHPAPVRFFSCPCFPGTAVIMPCWWLREVPPGGITSALTLPLQPYTYTKKRMTPSPE